MTRFVNSLQTQLYFILFTLAVLIFVAIGFNNQIIETTDTRLQQIDAVSLQRSNAYLLASLARRYANAENDAVQQSIGGVLTTTVENIHNIQAGLREGSATLEISAINNPNLLLLVDDIDQEWERFLALIATFTNDPNAEQAALLARIDIESVTAFTLADRLVNGLGFAMEQDQTAVQRLSVFIGVISLLAISIAIFIITRIVRSINRLSQTAQNLATGDLSSRAVDKGLVEVSLVGLAFNNMADEIETRISETEAARERAERSDQVKSAFLASMSHELRTPLNAIINFSHFVIDGDTGPVNEKQTELLTGVVRSAKHLLNLINDVLDMSKIEAGSLSLFIEDDVSVNALLKSVLPTGQSLLAGKSVQLATDIDDNLPLIVGDKQRIVQILLNILSNACKFTEEGEIKVLAYQEGQEIVIDVTDTGPGIAREDQAMVFEAFKQTTSGIRQGGGTGLGMPIARSLAEAHGGRLWLESEYGQGAKFYFVLPIKSDELVPMLA